MTDSWNPQQYQKFKEERDQPFYDLFKLVEVRPGMSVVDLGCGTGHLTKFLHQALKAKKTLGIDASEAMLKEASTLNQNGLAFQLQSIEAFKPIEQFDLIFSNAAFQWVPNHAELIKKLPQYLAPNGQIAIQIPSNFDYPTHTIAKEIASGTVFKKHLGEGREPSVLPIEAYAELFYHMGAKKQHVRLQIYGHVLESTESLIEWVKGSLLTYYRSRLQPAMYEDFLQQYAKKILTHFGDQKPIFYPFKRILLWAQFY